MTQSTNLPTNIHNTIIARNGIAVEKCAEDLQSRTTTVVDEGCVVIHAHIAPHDKRIPDGFCANAANAHVPVGIGSIAWFAP